MHNSLHALVSSSVRRIVLECAGLTNNLACDPAADPLQLFTSPAGTLVKEEIVRVGRKLWERQYVDGNGGNISARIAEDFVLCTPTLLSKGDLRIEDISMVNLNNERVCGGAPPTSEIKLHLEIYKALPQAQAVIHCHPPYATAHAIAGVIPQGNLIPEQEVFVGPVALSAYKTPGTQEFAETVLPFVRDHNTILLANHGIVCWADTVTHAEWYVEIVETYCKTVMIASQLRTPLAEIPPEKINDLLAIKKRLGLPDPRLPRDGDSSSDDPGGKAAPFAGARSENVEAERRPPRTQTEIDRLVGSLTDQLLSFFEK